jgi:type I restriction enzyme S subunit
MLVTQEELDAFGKPVMCASFCKRIKPKQGLSLLLAECISYEYNTEGLRKFEKRSAGNIINYHWKPFLSEYSVLIPDGETLAAFEKQAGQIRDKKSRAAQAIRFAREARDRLLPKLMSGEIEVEG